MTRRKILAVQISGFVAAVALLFFPAVPHRYFVASFGWHVIGDMLFVALEGLFGMKIADFVKNFKLSNYVRLAPWLQFVGLMLIPVSTVWFLLGNRSGLKGVLLGCGLALLAYLYRLRKETPTTNSPKLRKYLQLGGVGVAAIGLALMFFGVQYGALLDALGSSVAMAGFDYDQIYP